LPPRSQPLPGKTRPAPRTTASPTTGTNRAALTPRLHATRETTPAFAGRLRPIPRIDDALKCGDNQDGEPGDAVSMGTEASGRPPCLETRSSRELGTTMAYLSTDVPDPRRRTPSQARHDSGSQPRIVRAPRQPVKAASE
jgi:hypothetical protein